MEVPLIVLGMLLSPFGAMFLGPVLVLLCIAETVRLRRSWPLWTGGVLGVFLSGFMWLNAKAIGGSTFVEQSSLVMIAAALVALAGTAFVAVATDPAEPGSRSERTWGRAVTLTLGLSLIGVVAFFAGVAHFEQVNCWGDPNFDGDCDLGFIDGFVWAAVAVGVAIVVRSAVGALTQRPR